MPRWTLTKTFRFEASHVLPHHDGKCARLHGHSWVGHVHIGAADLQPVGAHRGMVVDFGVIKAVLEPLVEHHLDHWHLNESTGLPNPTSEELARWVYDRLAADERLRWFLRGVTIEETCTSSCRYGPEGPW